MFNRAFMTIFLQILLENKMSLPVFKSQQKYLILIVIKLQYLLKS